MRPAAHLVLANGEVFAGEAIGADKPISTGEVVFNTVMTGYQEVLTDPSYAGQIITFTYPHIGNYGIAEHDNESARAYCSGVIVRDLARRPSNWRSNKSLDEFLREGNISGISGIDTRRLTRMIRNTGAIPAAFGTASIDELREAAAAAVGTDGCNLAKEVCTTEAYTVGDGPFRVVAYDYGIKTTILRNLAQMATVEVVPADTPAEEVLAKKPDGVFLSNGPGDPSAVSGAPETIRKFLGKVPVFGICLGHQLLAEAIGGKTFKLPFGHHGGNHPVRNIARNSVEITSQNHNYAVSPEGLDNATITHISLNDQTVQGLRVNDAPAFSVQYHPEAGPGPHDARYLFAEFETLMREHKGQQGPRKSGQHPQDEPDQSTTATSGTNS